MAFSSIGKRKLGVHVLLIIFTILALVFAVRVNNFQEYYCEPGPLGLAIATLVILTFTFVLDIVARNIPTARLVGLVGLRRGEAVGASEIQYRYPSQRLALVRSWFVLVVRPYR
ncbi:hypothetical protein LXA43DRAFT_1103789 [Ganoderma leucocontextum]|nr:hypothetical protein LXA43DRAFT_1103789 [Ganoderma leucocontextum]